MPTVHTEYGPGRIIDQETVRGRTRYKVAGEGFEVWVDQTKLGGYATPDEPDLNAPHWDGYDLGDQLTGDAFGPGDAPLGEGYDRPGFDLDNIKEYRDYLRHHDYYEGEDPETGHYARRVAWAPMDDDNSTDLPYNPDPQHDAIDGPGYDDNSSTIQPIHHIDAEERLSPADSISFDDAGDEGDDEPGPDPDLFAREGMRREAVSAPLMMNVLRNISPEQYQKIKDKFQDTMERAMPGQGELLTRGGEGAMDASLTAGGVGLVNRGLDATLEATDPGSWGGVVRQSSRHEANPALLAPMLVRSVGPALASGVLGAGGEGDDSGPLDGENGDWGGVIEASARPAGLSDKYIDLTASVDYWNDPVAQFRHDPIDYINRVGHLKDEGLNPRFAEYMDLVEADGNIREAAWKDVRKKAMRLKTSGAVHVKDIAPNRIMASVDGDHGTYDVLIYKASSNAVTGSNAISNWHCDCEWGKWAYRRKFTFVGRLCSHAYASYLTMQSRHMRGKPRRKPGDPRNRPVRALPFDKVKKRADNLQNGPERLTPEMVVNDTDDAHIFVDVTKDERTDTGPDDVMSDNDIVHFARLMRHCEITEQPYPRQLVAFLARYADCDDGSDDTQADYQAPDSGDANEYLDDLREDADTKQEDSFGSMADRVREVQDVVEEAREHGADASRFVAMVRTADDGYSPKMPGLQPAGYRENTDQKGTYSWQPAAPASSEKPQSASSDKEEVKQSPSAPTGGREPGWGGPTPAPYTDTPASRSNTPRSQPPAAGQATQTSGQPTVAPPSATNTGTGGNANAGTGGGTNTGTGGAGANAGTGGGGGARSMTTGPVADGGKAGAENGNNSAITSDQLQDGYYTVGEGDTLTDIAQRAYGDMNRYQDLAKSNNIANPDVINVGDRIKIDNPTGNNGVSGDVTNPANGGPDGDKATQDFEIGETSPSGNTVSEAQGFAATTPKATTDAAAGNAAPPTPPGGDAATTAVKPPEAPAAEAPAAPAAPPNGGKPAAALRTARDWLRWAAEGDGTTNSTAPTTEQPAEASVSTNPETDTTGPDPETDTYDPEDMGDLNQQQTNTANPGVNAGGSNTGIAQQTNTGMGGMGLGDVGGLIGQGVGVASDVASGLGGSLPGVASGIGNAISGITSIFASKQDFDDFVRYAYPTAEGEGKLEPHTHPFAGSGYPGPMEIGTSEEYADKARKKADDVTDLGDDPLSTPMGDWQKQGATHGKGADLDAMGFDDVEDGEPGSWGGRFKDLPDDDDDSYREASIGYSTDDDSDIVRTFQAHLGDTALAPGAGQGAGRFDDIARAAQGFLRTAGRNYSLAEQSELIREGDKGGARNLDSLDLAGTHYEDMTTLGW